MGEAIEESDAWGGTTRGPDAEEGTDRPHIVECRQRLSSVTGTAKALPSLGVTVEDICPDHPAVLSSVVDRQSGQTVGRYTLIRKLGSGGMGVVYEAYDPGLDRKVAIKLLHPVGGHAGGDADSASRQAQARLLGEAQSLARFSHPNIVGVFDAGRLGDEVYITMELVDGQSMSEWFAAGPHPWRQVVELMVQAAQGLAAAHRLGIVHRDIKPDNMIIGSDGVVRLLDFGLATREHHPMSPSGRSHENTGAIALGHTIVSPGGDGPCIAGTPSYMAPEQHEGASTSEACDQFSFCVALYVGLTGQKPFIGDSLDSLAEAKRNQNFSLPIDELDCPHWLQLVLKTGLRPRVEERLASTQELVDLLQSGLAMSPGRAYYLIFLTTVGLACLLLLNLHDFQGLSKCRRAAGVAKAQWSSIGQNQVRDAFLAAAGEVGQSIFDRVAPSMSARLQAWGAQAEQNCDATDELGVQSQREQALREECLRTRLEDSHRLIRSWMDADVNSVHSAIQRFDALSPVADCENSATWLNAASLPRDPMRRRSALAVEAKLQTADLALDRGDQNHAIGLAVSALHEAEAIDFVAGQVESLTRLAIIQVDNFQVHAAREASMRAVRLASAQPDDRLLARAAIADLRLRAYHLQESNELEDLIARAQSAARRSGLPVSIHADLVDTIAVARATHGEMERAEAGFREALEILRDHPHSQTGIRLRIWNNLALALEALGNVSEAEPLLRRVYQVEDGHYGTHHPRRILTISNLALMVYSLGRYDEALRLTEEGLDLYERAKVSEPANLMILLSTRAQAHEGRGEFQQARELWQQCSAIHSQAGGSGDSEILQCLAPLLHNYSSEGDTDAIAEYLPQVLRLSEATLDDPSSAYDGVAGMLAVVHGQLALDNLEAAEASLDILQRAVNRFGREHFVYGKLFLPPDLVASLAVAVKREDYASARAGAEQLLAEYPEAAANERAAVVEQLAMACEGMADFEAAATHWSNLAASMRSEQPLVSPRIRRIERRAQDANLAANARI